jgi:hypothetical protein
MTLFSYVIPSDDTLLSTIELRPSIRERYSCPRLCINSIRYSMQLDDLNAPRLDADGLRRI